MKNFLKDLELAANKHFNKEETKEVVNYYEEIINDRISNGEDINAILKDYNVNTIVKEMIPEMLSKRDLDNNKTVGKSLWQLLIVLFSAPILIPLAITFIVIMLSIIIVAVSITFAFFASLLALIPYLIEVFTFTNSLGTTLGLLGIGLLSLVIIAMLGVFLLNVTTAITKQIIKWFSNLVVRKKAKK